MLPHVGVGGCAPKPRKLNPASSKIADAKLDDASTSIGPIILGRIWRRMMRALLKPIERAASTNSVCFRLNTWPRTNLPTSTHMESPTAINICHNPLPKANDMAITSSNAGSAHKIFITQLNEASTHPPKYPAREPTV